LPGPWLILAGRGNTIASQFQSCAKFVTSLCFNSQARSTRLSEKMPRNAAIEAAITRQLKFAAA
jgi:hypothetical protein